MDKDSKYNRIFPEVSEGLYVKLKEETQPKFIRNIFQANFIDGWWKKYLTLGMTPTEKLAQVFFFHEKAMNKELEAKYVESDFFWERAYRLFFKITDSDFTTLADTELKNLKDIIIKELFIDVHLAFYKGIKNSIQKENISEDRFSKHIKYVEDLTSKLPKDVFNTFLKNFEKHRINTSIEEENITQAILIAQKAATQFHEEPYFKEQALKLKVQRVLKPIQVNQNISSSQVKDIVDDLEKMRRNYPLERIIYDALGECYSILMNLTAKEGKFCYALLYLRKAAIYSPGIVNYDEWWKVLTEQMEIINKDQAPKLIEKLNSGRFYLTEEGEVIIENYKIGYSLLKDFIDSEEKELVKAEDKAILWQFCKNIGVSIEPLAENWEDIARELNLLVNKVIKEKPSDRAMVLKILKAGLPQSDNIEKTFSLEKATDFILTILNQTPIEPEESIFNLELELTSNQLVPKSLSMKKSKEPFAYWWFSRKDLASKAFLISTILFLGYIGIKTIQHNRAKSERDLAYNEIVKTLQEEENLTAIIPHVERFLSNPTVFGKDDRLESFVPYFEEKFGQWFMESKSINVKQIEEYKNLYSKLQ